MPLLVQMKKKDFIIRNHLTSRVQIMVLNPAFIKLSTVENLGEM